MNRLPGDPAARFAAFRDLHRAGRPLLLPNAWDHASAALFARRGFAAVGTTSLGVAAAAGKPDGVGRTRAETLALARLLTPLPCLVTVDVEGGFSDRPEQVAGLVAELGELGVVGVNLEDGHADGSLTDVDRQCEIVAAVKARAPHVFLNARTDTCWLAPPRPLAETVRRGQAYVAAGADGFFVPGMCDPASVTAVLADVPVPLNLLYPSDPAGFRALAELGVHRVSCGSLLFRAALHAASTLLDALAHGSVPVQGAPALSYAEVQDLSS